MLYRSYLSFLCLSIISCAISVSLSQLFLILSFLSYLFLKEKGNIRSGVFLLLVSFYSWQLLSFIYHMFANGFDTSAIALAWKGELKDIFLVSAFFVLQGVKEDDKTKISKAFQIFAYTILVTGFVSIFSETRLSRIISDLYRNSLTWPFQHHYGSFWGIDLYLPIGLMNTHLTFGGLTSFVFPFFFFKAYDAWKQHLQIKEKFIRTISFLLITIVFLFNSARSAMLGSAVSILLGIYILTIINKEFSKKTIRNVLALLALVVISLGVLYFVPSPIQKIIQPIFGSEKHTDSGRTFIWDSTFPLIKSNPIFGIGAGAYPKEIEIARKAKELEHPELAYFYEVTQRGHAHNDYFHLATIFGIPQVVLYLLLGGFIVFGMLNNQLPREHLFMVLSLSGFFFSGLLQCYFQDDEVLIMFYFLLGYYQLFQTKDESFQ